MIVVVGVPGSGKTFFARQFSDTFSAPFLMLDELREFTKDDKAIYELWDYMFEKLARTKQTMLVEGFGATQAERRELSAFAQSHGYQTLFVWVQTEPGTALIRASKGIGKDKPKYPLTKEQFKEAFRAFEPLVATEQYMVISGKHTYASQARNVLKKLAEPRAEQAKLDPNNVQRPKPAPVSSTPQRGRITIN